MNIKDISHVGDISSKRRSYDIHGVSVSIAELTKKLNLGAVSYSDQGRIKSWARVEFLEPYPKGYETHQLFIGFMYLLMKHVYPRIRADVKDKGEGGWVRVTPALDILRGEYDRDEKDLYYCTMSNSIPIRINEDSNHFSIELIGNKIFRILKNLTEDYNIHRVKAVQMNIYYGNRMAVKDIRIPTNEEVISQLYDACILSDTLEHILDKIPINT